MNFSSLLRSNLAFRFCTSAMHSNLFPAVCFSSSSCTVSTLTHSRQTETDSEVCPERVKPEAMEYDILIVGGGMVGAALGCSIAKNPLLASLRVAIIDSSSSIGVSQGMPKNAIPDPRVSAITPATVSFLKDMGAWDHIETCRHAPFKSMQVWDYTGLGYTRYNAADVKKPCLGYIVENNVLLSALQHCLKDAGLIDTICPAQVRSVKFPTCITGQFEPELSENNVRERTPSNETVSTSFHVGSTVGKEEINLGKKKQSHQVGGHAWAQVELEDKNCLLARLVVGADGARSKVRTMAGFKTLSWDYKQQAVICTVEMERGHLTAWQRFLPTGPLAILPMGDLFSNIVWSTTPERALDLKTMSDAEFVSAVNEALVEDYGPFPSSLSAEVLGLKLSSFFTDLTPSVSEPFEVPPCVTKVLTERLSFPLSFGHAYKYASSRVALIGDAAHTVHPLAGQGVNLGFGDAASLMNILSEGVKNGADIGEASLLAKYEKDRMLANIPMMTILDGLQRLFSANFGPVNFARAVGFQAVQLLGPLKQQIISYAMGERGLLKPLMDL
eukprot:c21604_g1_i1 orf=333-2006(-)